MEAWTLLREVELYAPENQGICHVLIWGEKVVEVVRVAAAGENERPSVSAFLLGLGQAAATCNVQVTVIDCRGKCAVPGLIDGHAHLIGGGGEKGPASRTPALEPRDLVAAGVSTVVGLLGTDGITRTDAELHAKVRGLNAMGMSAFLYSGSYAVPVNNTVTGSVDKDIVHIDEVLGVGEVCVSDFRGSLPAALELARLGTQVRVAGLIAGKAGVVHVHIGALDSGLQPLLDAVRVHQVPVTVFQPTHCGNRGPRVLEHVREWLRLGGVADFTADENGWAQSGGHASLDSLDTLVREGFSVGQMTLSSDAQGSFSSFDTHGRVTAYGFFRPTNLNKTLHRLVNEKDWAIHDALKLCTTNVADFLCLKGKGRILPGFDADLVVYSERGRIFDASAMEFVFVRGYPVMRPGDGTSFRPLP
ncbi:Isoaspartyl dipeptidase [Porphyridium purpureum]|uniref:Isoaspartyl dipeptidase n=1 Tax=Porphyridium purpureum TaxID=35688 RepID=A0A5J4YXC9_PORPP|nr:Isoaspartyl dipeptidase [Porphyridium purpureum]|eukprot:POR1801..scf209_3